MKKLNKKDIFFLLILFIFISTFILYLRIKGFGFASNVDWISQHVTIPEYFRNVFYETGNFFSKFSPHLGMGQNIFYFFYYGYLSPIILISYLLPFISMANYIQGVSILNIFISVYLLYKWINNNYNQKVALIATIIFAFSGPLFYHSHRHIMFVNYFPFLIGALIAVDHYLKNKKSLLLIFMVFLMIMTSFYFSIPGIIAIGIYSLYKIIPKKDYKKLLNIIFFVFISILLASFVLVPLIYAIYTGRSDTDFYLNLKEILIPTLNYPLTFYYTYSLGLSFIYVVSLVYNFMTKKNNNIFLGIVLSASMSIPIISFILNGFMYVDGKCFIPFLPIALIAISNFINDLFKNKVDLKKLLYLLIPVIIIMLIYAYDYNKINILITDILLIITFLFIIYKTKKHILIIMPIIFISINSFIILNNNEQYVKIETLKDENNYAYKELLKNVNQESIYRTLINDNLINKVNKVYSLNQYNTSIYSSASNQSYLKFVRDTFQNEVINKDYSTITGSNNVLFNIYSGNKYLITKNNPLIGYNEIITVSDLTLYENNDVLPIGYSSSKIMSLREFKNLEYPYTIDALLNYVIVDKSFDDVYKSNINKINLQGDITTNNIIYEVKNDKYLIEARENASIKYKLNKALDNKILIIKFKMDKEKSGYYCSSNITINGITNELSCNNWKYHNDNYTFEYVISDNKKIDTLDISFSKGIFEISNIEFYILDYKKIKTLNNNISPFIINNDLTDDNYIYGTIQSDQDGYFKLTIPYQKKGFTIYVDGVKTPHFKVDETFIGFEILKGEHIIEIKFNPPYLNLGLIISIIGIIFLLFNIFHSKLKPFWEKLINYLRKLFTYIKDYTSLYIINNRGYFTLFASLIILDLSLRIFYYPIIKFYSVLAIVPNLFTIIWIILILSLTKTFKNKLGKTIYLIFYIFYLIIFLVQAIYFSYFNTFFDFSVTHLAGEGAAYLDSVLLNIKYWVVIVSIISVYLTIKGLKIITHSDKFKLKIFIILVLTFCLAHLALPYLLGGTKSSVEWDDWRNQRSIYTSFNDNNKSMMVAGIFEYTVRDFYIQYLRNNEKISNEEENILTDNFSNSELNTPNNYTGIFKDKNLILIQLESIDEFLITKKIMPTTYELMKSSINFTNHFSFTSGGGSTFNSEFMVNTGYSTAYNYNQNAYSFSRNNYDFSLPNLLKKEGYISNAFHMNSGEYYSRGTNYKSFGYNNYYGLKNTNDYKDNTNYWLDRELILNKSFNKLLFKEDLFMNFIITYSAHMPYKSSKGTCSLLTDKEGLTEFECLKIQAKETDDFIKLLLEDLAKKDKLDKTVIAFFSDHYLYTLEDYSILDKYKITDNQLINKTPFFIWSGGDYKKNIKKINSQLDILPTILNLMGIKYYPNYYLGRDILDNDFKQIVYFNDGSWYDGKTYVKDGTYLTGKIISDEKINEINTYVKRKMILNDAVIKSNYFNNN
ncbi:MAG: YfhO family protein [Bacilli bacterium]|nr:YfhO family protein [Bacilli bacterium]